ncbi:MAG: hypothetical protein ACR2FY_04800 [Pirellulaceae bacterium]
MSRFAGRLWKWVVPAGITVGLLGLWAPAGAEDEKEIEIKLKKAGIEKVEVKKEGDEERKEGDRKEVKKEGERKEEGRKEEVRKEEGRKEEGRKEEVRKGEGSGDARIDELTRMVKQLAGQVGELREEVRGLRGGGFPGGPNTEEMKRRMEEAQKKFAAGNPGVAGTEKYREEMERRLKEQGKFAREKDVPGSDAEANIRREIERLNAQLKQISAAREREAGDKIDKKEPKKDADRKEDGDKKEPKKEGDKKDDDKKEGGDKKDDDKKDDDKKDDDKKEDKKA